MAQTLRPFNHKYYNICVTTQRKNLRLGVLSTVQIELSAGVPRNLLQSSRCTGYPALSMRAIRLPHCHYLIVAFVFATVLLAISSSASAAVISARSASLSDVTVAVQSAATGDTVTVPPGTATWASQLTITKNITLQGAGIGSTIISENLADRTGSRLIQVTLTRDNPLFRLTGFEFRSAAVSGMSKPVVQFNGGTSDSTNPPVPGITTQFRLDHCLFDVSLRGLPMYFSNIIGVVDHVTRNGHNQPAQVYMHAWNGKTDGHGSWADDPYWGTSKFLFFEDCTFNQTSVTTDTILYGIDIYAGSRCVSRHNTWHNATPGGHGTEAGTFRGEKQWEIYNDTYSNDFVSNFPQIRGGSVLMHDNALTNFSGGPAMQVYAMFSPATWGVSTGKRSWDNNAPNPTTGYWATGTHTGPNGTTLVDSRKNWANDQWKGDGYTFVLINKSSALDKQGNHKQASITGNTATTILHNSSNKVVFNTGDTYEIWKVLASLDQPGQGKGDLISGTFPNLSINDWPQRGYPLEPCYSWNNVSKGGSANSSIPAGQQVNFISGQPTLLKEGRDYYNRTPKPGYAPYIYPHPLTKGTPSPSPPPSAPSPPSNLQVVPGS